MKKCKWKPRVDRHGYNYLRPNCLVKEFKKKFKKEFRVYFDKDELEEYVTTYPYCPYCLKENKKRLIK